MIPFLPWTITIYIGCYIFWVINYYIGCSQERDRAFKFLSTDLLVKLICLAFFTIMPTANVRPEITGNQIWDTAMMWLYKTDSADNLFPSIHCTTSTLCAIAARKSRSTPLWYKLLSVIIAVLIYISTLTTKQHVIIDVIPGIIIPEVVYLFVDKSGFAMWYERRLTRKRRIK